MRWGERGERRLTGRPGLPSEDVENWPVAHIARLEALHLRRLRFDTFRKSATAVATPTVVMVGLVPTTHRAADS